MSGMMDEEESRRIWLGCLSDTCARLQAFVILFLENSCSQQKVVPKMAVIFLAWRTRRESLSLKWLWKKARGEDPSNLDFSSLLHWSWIIISISNSSGTSSMAQSKGEVNGRKSLLQARSPSNRDANSLRSAVTTDAHSAKSTFFWSQLARRLKCVGFFWSAVPPTNEAWLQKQRWRLPCPSQGYIFLEVKDWGYWGARWCQWVSPTSPTLNHWKDQQTGGCAQPKTWSLVWS